MGEIFNNFDPFNFDYILADFDTNKFELNFQICGFPFVSKSTEIKILLCKWGIAMKIYSINSSTSVVKFRLYKVLLPL